jgi:Leucine-rich repeat (LRR) protein
LLRGDSFDIKGLRALNLFFIKATDADLKTFKDLMHLRVLNLTQTKITDAGLKELTSLKVLDLSYTPLASSFSEICYVAA